MSMACPVRLTKRPSMTVRECSMPELPRHCSRHRVRAHPCSTKEGDDIALCMTPHIMYDINLRLGPQWMQESGKAEVWKTGGRRGN